VDDKKAMWVIAIVLVAGIFAGGWALHRYYDHVGTDAGRAVESTVQSAEDDNRAAGAAVNDAAGQIDDAEKALDRADAGLGGATDAAGRVQDSIAADQDILDECDGIIADGHRGTAEARTIFADIDRSNQGAGTQNQRSK
jgi:multidrug resistance efflux pump